METYFSIGEAAKAVHTTSETLRHYDRIGLVKPSKKDEWTNYRYYTQQDIVRLNTVRALQAMDLPLREVKQVLEYDDLQKIVDFLEKAEKKADEKIAALQSGKSKIRLAKADYEKKLQGQQNHNGIFIKEYSERVILLSDTLEIPTLDNLWNYLGHFYDKMEPSIKEQFSFEDMAGIYTENGMSRLFAVCTRHIDMERIKILPKGKYLCVDCTEENRTMTLNKLLDKVRIEYEIEPQFTVQLIVVSGILHWNYQIQVFLRE